MTAQTISQKILAKHAGLKSVEPGQLINCKVDLVLGNDITAPIAIEEMQRIGATKVFDPAKIVMVPDHFTPLQLREYNDALRAYCEDPELGLGIKVLAVIGTAIAVAPIPDDPFPGL